MFFRMIYDEKLAQAAYLIGCQQTGEAVVIDPERDVDRYLDLAAEQKLRIVATAETHIHADFLSGSRELAERIGATVYVSDEGDADWKYRWLDKKRGGGVYAHRLLKHGDVFNIGRIELRVLHTPGHTPEHISFLVTDRGGGANEPLGVATGDFVFVGDVGRPDLLETAAGFENVKEASARQLVASARKFITLPEFVQVWPAHGAGSACGKALGAIPQSTIGYERRFNPALKLVGDEQSFVNYVLEGQPEPPLYFGRMKTENRDGPAVLGKLPSPREWAVSELSRVDGRHVAVLDTRSWSVFRTGHIGGALFAPLTASFAEVAGSYVGADEDILLIIEADRVNEAVRTLVRIGLDRVVGFGTPDMLAMVEHGKLEESREIKVDAFQSLSGPRAPLILDVRRAAERDAGAMPGSINIAHTRLAARLGELPKDRPIVVHCRSGARSAYATALLQRHGYDVTNLAGGYLAWEQLACETAGVPATACKV